MGADAGATSGADNSAISIGGLAEFSDGLLELMADLARNASFPEDQFERERRQKIEGLRVERTTPGFLANERMRRILFGDHRYAVIAPTEEQVAAYRRDELQHFYHHHYTPSNALLLVVGDFSSEHMLAQVEKVFGGWKGSRPEIAYFLCPARSYTAARCISSICPVPSKPRFSSAISQSLAAIPIGSARSSRIRFTAAHFTRAS